LREVVDEDLGWLSVDGLDPARRVVVRTWIADNLVTDAAARLPLDIAVDRTAAITHLVELAQMASGGHAGDAR
jgi:hypothetical protein